MVEVTIVPKPKHIYAVDFTSSSWSILLPQEIGEVDIKETLRPCSSFPEGVYPGGKKLDDKEQVVKLHRFPNYLEFSKIIKEETVELNGNRYLTTEFFKNRRKGWSSKNIERKVGEVVGYCINGDTYPKEDFIIAQDMAYNIVYKGIVTAHPVFNYLVKQLHDGYGLRLTGADDYILNKLADFLLDRS